jgi:extracellular factor (EF) 3-hydroxypalmitic acid methyl ester biosynthesis protein
VGRGVLRASVLSLTRYAAAVEVYSIETVIKTSEVLEDFKIHIDYKTAYSGRAVVRNVVNTGTLTVCSVALEDHSFDVEFFTTLSQKGQLRAGFDDLVGQWQRVCRVLPEFKVAVADIQTFLTEMRLWLEQVELGIRSSPSADRVKLEREVTQELGQSTTPAITSLFDFGALHCRSRATPADEKRNESDGEWRGYCRRN